MSYDDPQMLHLENEMFSSLEWKIKYLCDKLYDSTTTESERRDLSMRVAILRQQLGAPTIDSMSNASEEEEEGS